MNIGDIINFILLVIAFRSVYFAKKSLDATQEALIRSDVEKLVKLAHNLYEHAKNNQNLSTKDYYQAICYLEGMEVYYKYAKFKDNKYSKIYNDVVTIRTIIFKSRDELRKAVVDKNDEEPIDSNTLKNSYDSAITQIREHLNKN